MTMLSSARGKQQAAARVLDELLGHDLPVVEWKVSGIYAGILKGQCIAGDDEQAILAAYAHHFIAKIEHEESHSETAKPHVKYWVDAIVDGVPVQVWTLVYLTPAETETATAVA